MSKRLNSKLEGLHYEILMEWAASNNESVLDEEMKVYLEQLDKVRGWHYSLQTEGSIIKTLMACYPKLTYSAAKTRYKDGLNFFYCDTEIRKEAHRNIYAQDMDRCYKAIILAAKEPKHYLDAVKAIKEVAAIRGLFNEEKDKIPTHLLEEKVPIIVMDPKKINLPEVDRYELAEQIKSYNITEKERKKIGEESGLTPFNVVKNDE